MKDIVQIEDGKDIQVQDWVAGKAANVLHTQIGSLEYAPTLGVDLDFFINSNFRFEKETFQVYLIQRLAESQVDVASVIEIVETFLERFQFSVREQLTP